MQNPSVVRPKREQDILLNPTKYKWLTFKYMEKHLHFELCKYKK